MKTKLLASVIMVILITGAVLAADPVGPKVAVINQKEVNTFKVIYEGEKNGKVNLKIYNQNGFVVFQEALSSSNGFILPINFNGMTEGEYTIEVIDGSGRYTQKVNYSINKTPSSIHVTKLTDDKKYLLAITKSGIVQNVTVRIFDGASKLVLDQIITVNEEFGLVYNLSKISGNPTFEITDASGNSKVIKY